MNLICYFKVAIMNAIHKLYRVESVDIVNFKCTRRCYRLKILSEAILKEHIFVA